MRSQTQCLTLAKLRREFADEAESQYMREVYESEIKIYEEAARAIETLRKELERG